MEEGKLRHFITGFDEYYIHSRDERFQNLTDYVVLLWDFNWYHAKHPDSNLKEIYECTLEEMLCSEMPSYIYCATVCVLTQIEELEGNPNFHFELTDEKKYLRLVVSSMKLHHESIVEFIDKLYDHQVYAERFYRVVLDKAVSYLDKKEKQEDTAEQCQQCEEEAVFVLYEGHWAGKAENGEDKIFLRVFEDECVITYESFTRNCYAAPPKEDVRSDARYHSLSKISTWSLEDLLLFINRAFHLSISICDCCSEEQYRAWIEQQNTEFYSMEIMVDGTRQECMVRRVNERSCEEIRFQGQTYFWKETKAIHGLRGYDYAVEVCLNEKAYYLYHTDIPNKNETLWVVSQITESTFELLKHQPCDHEKIVFGREIGEIDGYEAGRWSTIYKVLALATGRTIGYYQADARTRNICLETRGRNMTFEEKIAPIYIPILAEYQMKMHTTSGEAYCFTLTGLKAYYPNTGGYCGCGSDEWCFHCKYNGENYILRFCDDSSYGTYWDCALLHKENAEQLDKLSAIEWLKLVQKSETQIFHLHPDTIDDAKNIVQDTSSRCGPISDNGFYGISKV